MQLTAPNMLIKIKKLTSTAKLPSIQTVGSACFDLHADLPTSKGISVSAGQRLMVPTGLAFEVPVGFVMLLFSRSGHVKSAIRLANCVGVIDSDYRGQVLVMLACDAQDEFEFGIAHGDRIAQAMVIRHELVTLIEVAELSETKRGEGGFGSTGVS